MTRAQVREALAAMGQYLLGAAIAVLIVLFLSTGGGR